MISQKWFYGTIAFVLCGVAFFRLGHIVYRYNPWIRELRLNEFVSRSKSCNCINIDEYYELRDSYAAEAFTLNPEVAVSGLPFLTLSNGYLDTKDVLTRDRTMLAPASDVVVATSYGYIAESKGKVVVEVLVDATKTKMIHGFVQHFQIPIPDNVYWKSYAVFH